MSEPPFSDLEGVRACLGRMPAADAAARAATAAREADLTKPAGSLGRLEELAVWHAGWRGRATTVVHPLIVVFAANHGVVRQGVSAYPAEVTAQMVANFEAGGAAINQLARLAGAALRVVPLKLDAPTADFTHSAAMEETDLVAALQAGWRAVEPGADLVVPGEMGIGNTTAATAVAAALFGGPVADWAGAGTGLDAAGVARKAAAVETALARHGAALGEPLEVLRRLGGREMAAMAGAVLAARHGRIPVLLDGFIATAAAAVLARAAPGALDHVRAGHVSAEAGHRALLARLGKTPLLDLGLRLGEGTGAALAIGVLRGALACHAGMATFAEAGVGTRTAPPAQNP